MADDIRPGDIIEGARGYEYCVVRNFLKSGIEPRLETMQIMYELGKPPTLANMQKWSVDIPWLITNRRYADWNKFAYGPQGIYAAVIDPFVRHDELIVTENSTLCKYCTLPERGALVRFVHMPGDALFVVVGAYWMNETPIIAIHRMYNQSGRWGIGTVSVCRQYSENTVEIVRTERLPWQLIQILPNFDLRDQKRMVFQQVLAQKYADELDV